MRDSVPGWFWYPYWLNFWDEDLNDIQETEETEENKNTNKRQGATETCNATARHNSINPTDVQAKPTNQTNLIKKSGNILGK